MNERVHFKLKDSRNVIFTDYMLYNETPIFSSFEMMLWKKIPGDEGETLEIENLTISLKTPFTKGTHLDSNQWSVMIEKKKKWEESKPLEKEEFKKLLDNR